MIIKQNGNINQLQISLIVSTIVLATFFISSLFWILIHAARGPSNPVPTVETNAELSLIAAILFGAATVALTFTAIGVALITLFGFEQIKKSALEAAAAKADETSQKVAKPIARQISGMVARNEAHRATIMQFRDGGEIRKILIDRVSHIYNDLVKEVDTPELERLIEAKIEKIIEKRTPKDPFTSAADFSDDPYGDAPSNQPNDSDDGDGD